MIYLDHAAATPVSKKAKAAMEPYFSELFFNPSAPYLPAKQVKDTYKKAKDEIAHTIGAKGADLIITAGATESINLAFTVADKNQQILYLSAEHTAVRAAAENHPHAEIAVDQTGRIILDDLAAKITENTVLISVALANNELGTVQPIAEIAELIKQERDARRAKNNSLPLYLHSDASQALNLLDINVARLGVDLLTINAAKVGGPKGVGALYLSHQVKLKPIVKGGGQEQNLRSGTENVPGVMGFAAAATETKEHLNGNRKKYQKLAELLKNELKNAVITPQFLGNKKHSLVNFVPVCFPGIDAERLIYKLEEQGVYLSTGAACAASKGEKSHVLSAIGLSDEEIAGSLRISLGVLNNEDNIKQAGALIVQAVNEEAERLGL